MLYCTTLDPPLWGGGLDLTARGGYYITTRDLDNGVFFCPVRRCVLHGTLRSNQPTKRVSERGVGGEEAGAREVEKRDGKNAKEVRRARV